MDPKDFMKQEVEKHFNTEIDSYKDVSGHANKSFMVKLDNGEEVVFTVFKTDNPVENCRKEVKVNKEIKRKTSLPTPKILFSNCENGSKPSFYISKKVEGINGQELFEARTDNPLNPEERLKLTKNIGEIMGELHSVFTFTEAGEITVEKEEIEVKNSSKFTNYFSNLLKDEVENLSSTNFSSLQQEVSKTVEKALDKLNDPIENCLIHHDIRPDNLILDRTKIKAVLDWEHVTSSHPLIDYAHTEIHLAEPHLYYDVKEPEKYKVERLREELRKGYQKHYRLPENYRSQIELLKLIEHIRYMNSFEEYADSVGMSSKERKNNRKDHKKRFKTMQKKLESDKKLVKILE